MATLTPALTRQNGLLLLPAIAKLAGWRFKQMWRFLLVTWLGLLAMVVLVCAGPLFSHVTISAYFRSLLANAPDGPYITVEAVSTHPTSAQLQQIKQQSDQLLHQSRLGSYLQGTPQLVVLTPPLDMLSAGKTTPAAFVLNGYDSTQASQHTNLMQGRLPQVTTDGTVEIALSQDAASNLGLRVGSVIQGRFPIALGSQAWKFRVVGIIAPKLAHDPFWAMANPFSRSSVDLGSRYYTLVEGSPSYNVLAASEAIRPKIAVLQATGPSPTSVSNETFQNDFVLFWRYPVDLSHLDATDITALSQQTSDLDVQIEDTLQGNSADLVYANAFGTILATLHNSANEIVSLQIEMTFLLLITLALVLFLVSLMSDVLVERQAAIIATLRSRGATRRHIFGAFVTQGIVLGIAALLVGPLLAILLVRGIAQLLLSSAGQQSLSVITGHPIQSLLDVKWYAVAAVAVAFVVMILAVNRATRMDIVTLRRETSRMQRVPLWRRLNLDLFFALLLLVGYIAFVYFWPFLTIAGGQINPDIYVLLTNLGALASPLFVVAVLLLFLRLFPLILRLAGTLAAKKRSAPPVLALAQMERAPRPAARIVVLLALAIASSCFLFTLIATKEQRNVDVANFFVQGADFSGSLPLLSSCLSEASRASGVGRTDKCRGSDASKTFGQLQTYYSGLSGVQSATLGYRDVVQLNSTQSADQSVSNQGSLTINAVDAATYAQTAIWSPAYSSQPLSNLTAQLVSHRSAATSHNVVYALVDAATWQRLNLSPGQQFNLPVDSSGNPRVNFIALAQINYVPGVYDNSVLTSTGMGLIVDYSNYTAVKARVIGGAASSLLPNYIWLRTQDDAASLAHIRSVLPDLRDRREILATMQDDPGHLGIIGVLDIAVAAALMLALLGTLISSWFNAASRLTNFAIARALGMAPHQVAAILLWEQGFVYILALLLGAVLGAMLTIFVGPTVSALTIMHGHAWDQPLNIPPIQIIIPYPQLLLILGVLVLICLAALLLMARIVSRPSISQTLRLNED